ncbi:MAG: hypothetical protein HBSAPP03_20950 [Phycisphaerae bacterium]|nr:MAG: hypothetical protein HBSAPP03_20950 [Phycisphaerae bacterium]
MAREACDLVALSTTDHHPGVILATTERRYRLVEFAALFGVMPALLAVPGVTLPLWAMLGSAFVLCGIMLACDRTFDRRVLWNSHAVGPGLPGVLGLWLVALVVLGGIVWALAPDWFLSLPRERPGLWLLICVAYPLFSVYPQNVVYRAFIFHRYRGVFADESSLIWASAAAFSWAHVVFHHPIAILLTFAGGLIFAQTYRRSRSLLLVSLEHALYGLLVFTIGLGHALYLPR